MSFNLGHAADLVDASIQRVFPKFSEKLEKDYPKYYNITTGVTDYYTKDSSVSGLKYAGRTLENAVITQLTPVQGFDKTYTQEFFDDIIGISRYMYEFGIKKRNLESITRECINALADLREKILAERLDNGWSTSYIHTEDSGGSYSRAIVGGNGVELFSTAQTREDAGTDNKNVVNDGTTYNMDFDYDALKAARRTASLIKNPQGKPMRIMLDTLVCKYGSSVHSKAEEILAAMKKGKIPESADNDGSAQLIFNLVTTPWLANDAYWFMLDSKMKNDKYGLQYLETNDISLSEQNIVFLTKEIQYSASLCFSCGHNDYRGIVGSEGDNT